MEALHPQSFVSFDVTTEASPKVCSRKCLLLGLFEEGASVVGIVHAASSRHRIVFRR